MEEGSFITIACLVCFFLGMIFGGIIRSPDELENGCIVHNNKIYCEVEDE